MYLSSSLLLDTFVSFGNVSSFCFVKQEIPLGDIHLTVNLAAVDIAL